MIQPAFGATRLLQPIRDQGKLCPASQASLANAALEDWRGGGADYAEFLCHHNPPSVGRGCLDFNGAGNCLIESAVSES
ncbi:MAG: hypothetical protein VX414_00815 [Candidatus Thermoplasmatota archaeon]|nr:hypothetical protein [Candidatus Thermoplasmatota archaeon]